MCGRQLVSTRLPHTDADGATGTSTSRAWRAAGDELRDSGSVRDPRRWNVRRWQLVSPGHSGPARRSCRADTDRRRHLNLPAPPTPGVPPATTCATPDPFAILGGGTCAGWQLVSPGHHAALAGSATHRPILRRPRRQLHRPPTTPTTCGTPDPFAILGGGTCANGGWYPPGMTPPTAATPPSAPVTVPGGCTTPDPFVILGGGQCIAGNWYPPGGP